MRRKRNAGFLTLANRRRRARRRRNEGGGGFYTLARNGRRRRAKRRNPWDVWGYPPGIKGFPHEMKTVRVYFAKGKRQAYAEARTVGLARVIGAARVRKGR